MNPAPPLIMTTMLQMQERNTQHRKDGQNRIMKVSFFKPGPVYLVKC